MRFVILEHHERVFGCHIDLMFEQPGGKLLTWRLALPPSPAIQPAERLPDHRERYLSYQGPIYPDRGWVQRWDEGRFDLHIHHSTLFRAHLHGHRIEGLLELETEDVAELEWTCKMAR